MTDISTSCKKFDMWPGSRLLEGEYEKTVIIVSGAGNMGKSTLSSRLLNENICFVGTDSVCIRPNHSIKSVLDYLEEHKDDNPIDIGKMGIAISEMPEYKEFIDHLFDEYIVKNEFKDILMEGHLMTIANIREYFIQKCVDNKIRVWLMGRIV